MPAIVADTDLNQINLFQALNPEFMESLDAMEFVNPADVSPITSPSTTSSPTSLDAEMEQFRDLTNFMPLEVPRANYYLDELFPESSTTFTSYNQFELNGNEDTQNKKINHYQGYEYYPDNLNLVSAKNQPQIMNNNSVGNMPIEMLLYQQSSTCPSVNIDTSIADNGIVNRREFAEFNEFLKNVGVTHMHSSTTDLLISNKSSLLPQKNSIILQTSNVDQQLIYNNNSSQNYHTRKQNINLTLNESTFKNEENISSINTPDVIDSVVDMETSFIFYPPEKDIIAASPGASSSSSSSGTLSATTDLPCTSSSLDIDLSSIYDVSLEPSKISENHTKSSISEKKRKSKNDDKDYVPPTKYKKPVFKSERLTSDSSDDVHDEDNDSDYVVEKPKKKKTGKPRGRPKKQLSSTPPKPMSPEMLEKENALHRAMRDKNNEASRKSRLKRKIHEMALANEENQLTTANLRLKARIEETEKIIKRMEDFFQMIITK